MELILTRFGTFTQKLNKYFKEMNLNEVEEKFKIDLSEISAGGTAIKIFNFVVKTTEKIFVIETNFIPSNARNEKKLF